MAKRKEPDTPSKSRTTPSKRSRRELETGESQHDQASPVATTSPQKRQTHQSNGVLTPSKRARATTDEEEEEDDVDATPRPNGKTLFATPSRKPRSSKTTPSRSTKADRSAKRRSALALADAGEDDDWDNSTELAREILDDESDAVETTEGDTVTIEAKATISTPSKRGRPKGAKNKRSPTPEGDLAPEERYFFQNRIGPPRVSSNIFSSLGLLTVDEYFKHIREYKDHHDAEKNALIKLHTRSFPQWKFELEEGFNVCMYGYGSKRKLMDKFAEWLYTHISVDPRIVVLNGYMQRVNIRNVLSVIGSALVGEDEEMKLTGQPHEMVDTILSHLTHHVKGSVVILINSIDSTSLRKPSIQSVLARLAAHQQIHLVASADTPTFPILWNSTLKDQFRFVFHDCTTFAPYEVETNPVDDVNELLGRKTRRAGGKEGIGFVLKSLPENARNLYRILLAEILTIVNDGVDGGDGDDDGLQRGHGENAEEVGVEYRTLYQKALEEFVCSSDINFRFLLKEFHDHQMLTSRRDTSGTELLGVPLQKDEMEAVLEDLVIG